MTNFEKMKYLHRNAGKISGAGRAGKKTAKAAGKKKAVVLPETAGEETDEERSSGSAENIPG